MKRLLTAVISFTVMCSCSAETMHQIFSNVVGNCECSALTVECSDEYINKVSPYAEAVATGCSMYLKKAACAELKVQPGIKKPADFINSLPCTLKDLDGASADTIFQRVNSCGIVIHEMVHNCTTLPPYQAVCEEVAGTRLKMAFSDKAFSIFCATPAQQGPATNLSPICKKLCIAALNEEVITSWTRCLCDASKHNDSFLGLGEWLTPSECCSCNKRCKAKALSSGSEQPLPEFCKAYFRQPDVAKPYIDEWNEACDKISFNAGHYSCGRMSKNGPAQFGTQCP